MKLLVPMLVFGVCAMVRGGALEWEPAVFSVETTVLLDEAPGPGPGAALERGAGPGYRLHAALSVAPVWADGTDTLLRLHLTQVKLHARGAHPRADWLPRPSPWDAWPQEPFHALLHRGALRAAHLPPDDHPDHANYKRALLALFQFQEEAGEREETDVSGTCRVLYETVSELEFRKIKRECVWAGDGDGAAHNDTESWGDAVAPRRVTRYTRGGGGRALAEVYAEEVVELVAPGAALKARSWHRLRRVPDAPAPAPSPRAASLRDALQALPPPAPLPLQAPSDHHEQELELELEPAVAQALGVALDSSGEVEGSEEGSGWEGAGEGGSARQAAGVLEALPALRAAAAPALQALLARYTRRPDLLGGAVRLLGLTGTRAAHAAAGALLQLRDEPLRPLADLYLDALALAPRHDEEVVRDVLQLGASARDARVAGAALLAAAAAASRRPGALADAVRDALVAQLARCKDDECRSVRLLALGNLRRADVAPALLRHAEEDGRSAALAALDALGAAPARAVPPAACRRLLRLALSGRPLVVRAAALDLAVVRYFEAPGVPLHLAVVARDLEERAPAELRRVFRQRLAALAETHPAARRLLLALPAPRRGWAGTSTVLGRSAGWGAGGWGAALQSVQVAAGGLLQRGEVRLLALEPAGAPHDALGVQLWTRGLAALAGGAERGEPDEEPEEEEAAGAGLAFSVTGVRLLPVTLFTGQAELMGHVWAGSGSTATPALRAVAPLRSHACAVPLHAGALLRHAAGAALAAALDAQAQVSLWSRTARSLLQLRAGVAVLARARLRTAWADLRVRAAARSDPALHIAADIDFYDKVDLCVRVHLDDHDYRYNTSMTSEVGARRWRVRRERARVLPRAGRTLALGARNDASCEALRAAD